MCFYTFMSVNEFWCNTHLDALMNVISLLCERAWHCSLNELVLQLRTVRRTKYSVEIIKAPFLVTT